MLNFIDNHDMDRFLYIAGGRRDALERAVAMQMAQPGPPIIYYGTEVGMGQRIVGLDRIPLEANRLPMAWGDDQDAEVLAIHRRLIEQRREARPWERAARLEQVTGPR